MIEDDKGRAPPLDYWVVFQNLPGLLAILTTDFKFVDANPAYCAATMIERGEVLGRNIFDVFPDNPADPDATASRELNISFQRVLQNRAPDRMAIVRYDIRRTDPEVGGFEERYWTTLNSPLLDDKGEVAYIIVRAEDVTEFTKLQQQSHAQSRLTDELRGRIEQSEAEIFARSQEVADKNRQLEEVNRELVKAGHVKSEFISIVSHELRTPLTSIRGSLGLVIGAMREEVPEKARRLVEIALRNSERLILLINDILDIDKIAAGQMRFDIWREPLAPLLHQAVDANRGYAERFVVNIRLEEPSSTVAVDVDAGRFIQVLSNLLSNAIKFSKEGSKVNVSTVSFKGKVRIYVTDTGPGIPEEFRCQIFGKFSQSDVSATRQQGGTGLGLYITKQIVERMGGQIGFDTEIGKGTVFWVEFPCLEPQTGERL